VFDTWKANLVSGGHPQFVFSVAQAQAATFFDVLHVESFWSSFVSPLLGSGNAFGCKDRFMAGLSRFGKTAVTYQLGRGL
jgi:hypothetical protein